jgi:hypothetical protein
MPRGPRTPLKQGRNGTRSINKQLAALTAPATTTVAGLVKQGTEVANATDAASAITQLNALITSLETAGIIVTV